MIFSHPTSTDDLVQEVLTYKHHMPHRVHGLDHWQRVERNGLYLADREGGNSKVDLSARLILIFNKIHFMLVS